MRGARNGPLNLPVDPDLETATATSTATATAITDPEADGCRASRRFP